MTDTYAVLEVYDSITGEYWYHSEYKTRDDAYAYATTDREDTWIKYRIVVTEEYTV